MSSDESYGDKHFWDERYASTCSTLFDWYQDWETLAAVVQPLLRPTSRVLHLGCGNSPLAEQLHDAGVTDVTSVDYSAPAVEHMRLRNAASRPRLRFEVADCRALALPPAAYDLVLDKGLLDAMVCSPSPEAGVRAMLDAVALGLAPGGCFVLVSYGAPAERTAWLAPEQRGWEMEVWTLPKPGMGGELGERPTAERYAPERDIEGRRHYIYLLRRPLDAAPSEGDALSMRQLADSLTEEAAPESASRWAF